MKYIIPGKPLPSARPRFSTHGGYVHTYDSQKKEKDAISLLLKEQHGNLPLYSCPLFLDISFFVEIPASYSHKKRLAMHNTYCSKRPDFDNYLKLICDAANQILWVDDALIVKALTQKIYSLEPMTVFSLEPIKISLD